MSEELQPVMTSLSTALGMSPLVLSDKTSAPIDDQLPVVIEETELSQADQDAEDDFAVVRENTKELLENGKAALDGILRIAEASEHPRAFEVAANLLKTMQDMNSGLLKLHEQRRQLVPVPEAPKVGTQNITNNNVFVGTTQELLDMLDEREREKDVIEHDNRA